MFIHLFVNVKQKVTMLMFYKRKCKIMLVDVANCEIWVRDNLKVR